MKTNKDFAGEPKTLLNLPPTISQIKEWFMKKEQVQCLFPAEQGEEVVEVSLKLMKSGIYYCNVTSSVVPDEQNTNNPA